MRRRATRNAIGLGLLALANILVFATEMLAFLWPVMLMVDAGSVAGIGRRRPRRRAPAA